RNLLGSPSGGSGMQHLSDLGIAIARDGAGNLSVDSAKLDAALRNPAAVRQFFTAEAGADASATGFATRFAAFTQAAIGADGTLAGKTQSLQTQKTANTRDQARVSDRLTLTEARLRKQYTALDTQMASLTALNTYVTQQIAQWNKSTG
ncbi:MAG: flagellar hook protein, partial [Comamonadaceae bacterium]